MAIRKKVLTRKELLDTLNAKCVKAKVFRYGKLEQEAYRKGTTTVLTSMTMKSRRTTASRSPSSASRCPRATGTV